MESPSAPPCRMWTRTTEQADRGLGAAAVPSRIDIDAASAALAWAARRACDGGRARPGADYWRAAVGSEPLAESRLRLR